jgi:hypothetical protein
VTLDVCIADGRSADCDQTSSSRHSIDCQSQQMREYIEGEEENGLGYIQAI